MRGLADTLICRPIYINNLSGTGVLMAYESGILLKSGTNEMEIVEFYLDEPAAGRDGLDSSVCRVCYGINVAKVLEIIRKPAVNKVPMYQTP